MPAVPGFKPPVKALCVVPQGMQEGSELLIEGRELGLLTGHPAEFRFYSSPVRSSDRCPAVHLRRFVPDSSLEQARFELPVPPPKDRPSPLSSDGLRSMASRSSLIQHSFRHAPADPFRRTKPGV